MLQRWSYSFATLGGSETSERKEQLRSHLWSADIQAQAFPGAKLGPSASSVSSSRESLTSARK